MAIQNHKLVYKILAHIKRAELAYEEYAKDKLYIQALRIYSSNKKLIKLLEKLTYQYDDHLQQETFKFIFHLEDWLNQFHDHEKLSSPRLNDKFIFDRLDVSIPYPKDYKNLLKTVVK